MKKFQNIASVAALVIIASLAAACGSDKKGAGAKDAVKADGTCSDSFMTEAKKINPAEGGATSLEDLKAICARAKAFASKYAGVKCKAKDEDGKIEDLVVDAEYEKIKKNCDKIEAGDFSGSEE